MNRKNGCLQLALTTYTVFCKYLPNKLNMDNQVDLSRVPVSALRKATISMLSGGLNSLKVLPTEEGLPRDWRGLAHLIGLNGVESSRIDSSSDPFAVLLNLWGSKGTVEQLQQFLALIDRFDVLEDSQALIDKDVDVFMNRATSFSTSTVSCSSQGSSSDAAILTVDDVVRLEQGLDPQQYDAYLLFAEEDIDFASNIVHNMEQQYKMKLCIRDRDLVGGIAFEHDAIMKLIAERCRRLLVVVTPSFLKSTANKFFVTFAQALGIDQRQRKVIPILYKKCDLPPELSYYFLLDYSRAGVLWNFWEKLRDSIQTPDTPLSPTTNQSPWMSHTMSLKPQALQTPPMPEPEPKKQPVEEPTKKALLKSFTSSFSNLVTSNKYNDTAKEVKDMAVNGVEKPKKKWFRKKKVDPLLS